MSPPGDYFTFNQPNIKYLYVICCFYTLGLADSKKFHHVCKFIFAIIFAIMLTCNFFARNQQKHHLAVESWSFKEAATFGSRSTEEFCATRGILRAPFGHFSTPEIEKLGELFQFLDLAVAKSLQSRMVSDADVLTTTGYTVCDR